jgi:glycosyltransferase involved in cell wall biosynthesis
MNSLSIVVPVFNEARRLPIVFAALDAEGEERARAAELDLTEVIVVDDGSTDETPQLLAARRELDPRLGVIRFEHNRGKGAAVRAGVLAAAGSHVLMTDVDLSTPLSDLQTLAAALRDGNDVAIGSRALPSSRIVVHQPRHRELMGKSFNMFLRLLTQVPYRDTQCGFKLFVRERAQVLFEVQRVEGFAFDAELCLNAARLGLRIAEVPISWTDNRETKVTLVRSSLRMSLDLFGIAWRAHRPLHAAAAVERPIERSAPNVEASVSGHARNPSS